MAYGELRLNIERKGTEIISTYLLNKKHKR